MEVAVAKFTEAFILCLCMTLTPAGTKVAKITIVQPAKPVETFKDVSTGDGETFKIVKTDQGWDVSSSRDGYLKLLGKITADPKNPALFTMTVNGKRQKVDLTEAIKLIRRPLGKEEQDVKLEQGKIMLAAPAGPNGFIVVVFDGKPVFISDFVPRPRATTQPASAPTSAPTSRPATRPATALDKVMLRDVGALRGGQVVFIAGSGACAVQIIKPGQGGLQENRYNLKLTDEQMLQLADLIDKHNFFTVQIAGRPGVPDEGRPEITVRLIGGKERAVSKWSNDKNEDFDAVHQWLLGLTETLKGEPVYTGKYDYKWWPKVGD